MTPSEIFPYLQYLAPPVVGSFIGYVTNKIAIKMLFRPLKPWHIFGLRVPMTPGVIPAKRHQLAENMGKMVADYLVTEHEVQKMIAQPQVQEKMQQRISQWGEEFANKDLGSVKDLVPEKYSWFYDHTTAYLVSKSNNTLNEYIRSEHFKNQFEIFIKNLIANFLQGEISSLVDTDEQDALFNQLEQGLQHQLGDFLAGDNCKEIVKNIFNEKTQQIFAENKTLGELLPDASKEFIVSLIETQIPSLLNGLDILVKDENIREKIVVGGCGGVENFISSMGSMAPMVSNFVKMDVVKEKLHEYLNEKEDEIITWLHGPEMEEKVTQVLLEQLNTLYLKPISELFTDPVKVEDLNSVLAEKISNSLASGMITSILSSNVTQKAKEFVEQGGTAGELLKKMIGEEGEKRLSTAISRKCLENVVGEQSQHIISEGVDYFFTKLERHKIGKLSGFLNPIMRTGIYTSSQKFFNKSLITAIPEMVGSFNLQSIISEKIDSLDLIKLESLLLSIMEEQFKYINLFGAFLGFILGCLNLLFLVMN